MDRHVEHPLTEWETILSYLLSVLIWHAVDEGIAAGLCDISGYFFFFLDEDIFGRGEYDEGKLEMKLHSGKSSKW